MKKTIKQKVMERYYRRLAKEQRAIAECHAGWSSSRFEPMRNLGDGSFASIDRLPSSRGNTRDLV